MLRMSFTIGAAALLVTAVGCQSSAVHTVPVSRDYSQLSKDDPRDVESLVDQAHRVGAQHYAPYEYFSAEMYLAKSYDERAENGRRGEWDYAALARQMAEAAISKGGIPDGGELVMPENYDGAVAEFERLKARYQELDKEKAIEVSPVLYAHIEAALSSGEHEILERCHYPEGIRYLRTVEADIDTIWSQDVDGDGIIDMKDGAPWAPEDKDGFEDEDGIPDPDNDQDGELDLDDVMPNDPETANRWHDFDGAPDTYPVLETIRFANGSATLSADAKGYLRGIAELLKEWPELKFHIKGHTDNTASEAYNQKLSERRSNAVQQYLIEHGAPAGQIVVSALGEGTPAADNSSAAGRAENRRVEVILE